LDCKFQNSHGARATDCRNAAQDREKETKEGRAREMRKRTRGLKRKKKPQTKEEEQKEGRW